MIDQHPSRLQTLIAAHGIGGAIEQVGGPQAMDYLLRYQWDWIARPEQLPPPGQWLIWLLMTGRGWGKTRTGASTVQTWAQPGGLTSGRYRRFYLVGATAADVRDVMIEGESGILACAPPDRRPDYEPSKRRLTWPNGAEALTRSADEPDRIRGPQGDCAWADELASWRYLDDAWTQLELAVRLGVDIKFIVTTTPKPRAKLKQLISRASTVLVRGSTYENAANLAPQYVAETLGQYEGTRTGLQELYGILLEEAEGALWTRQLLEDTRRQHAQVPYAQRIVVALDPADGKAESDEQGICVAALGGDWHYYVLWSEGMRESPRAWLHRAFDLADHYGADLVLWEKNHGGEWIAALADVVLQERRSRGLSDHATKAVSAAQGKRTRAEPIAALFEQHRAHLVGTHPELEDQLVNFTGQPGEPSPDRLDAMVWALQHLRVGGASRVPTEAAPVPGQSGTTLLGDNVDVLTVRF